MMRSGRAETREKTSNRNTMPNSLKNTRGNFLFTFSRGLCVFTICRGFQFSSRSSDYFKNVLNDQACCHLKMRQTISQCRVEVESEIRIQVDDLMRQELKNLKAVCYLMLPHFPSFTSQLQGRG